MKTANRRRKPRQSRQEQKDLRGLNMRKIFSIIFLASLLLVTLGTAGYVIFFRTVLS